MTGRTRVVGLTGGIGTGKSTVARMLEAHGARVVDADQLARDVVAPGSEALAAIRARFGPEVFDARGALDRKALGALIFSDRQARKDLEAITHPHIQALANAAFEAARREGVPVVVYDAALIVELGLQRGMDGLIVVRTDPDTQLDRVVTRDGLDPDAAQARIAAQLPLREKEAVATWVVDNTGSLADTARQVEWVWGQLTDGGNGNGQIGG